MALPSPRFFLFGAGATRGAFDGVNSPPPPLDSDFFDIASRIEGHETQKLVKKVLRDVWKLYGRTSGVSLEGYYRDIETRALVLQFAKTGNKPKDWAARQENLEELIRRVLIHTTCYDEESPVRPRSSAVHKRILKVAEKGDTIVTFNYDTVIEEAFEDAKLWNPVTGYGQQVHGKSRAWCRKWLEFRSATPAQIKDSRVTLLKLHGSLHWELYNNSAIRLKPLPYVLSSRSGWPRSETISILPPGWRKEIEKNPYRQFWRTARLQLEKARSIFILGYSMPETDYVARAMFSEVVRLRAAGKRYLQELHVADPNPQIQQRMIDLFAPALGPTGKVCRYSGITKFAELLEMKD